MVDAIGHATYPSTVAAGPNARALTSSTPRPQQKCLTAIDRLGLGFPARTVADQGHDLMLVLVPRIDREEALTAATMPQRLPVPDSVLDEVTEPHIWCFV